MPGKLPSVSCLVLHCSLLGRRALPGSRAVASDLLLLGICGCLSPQPCPLPGGVEQMNQQKTVTPRAYRYQSRELVWVALAHSRALLFSPASPAL